MYDDELLHYGIKGMKWGRVKTLEQIAAANKKKDFKRLRKEFEKNRWAEKNAQAKASSIYKKLREEGIKELAITNKRYIDLTKETMVTHGKDKVDQMFNSLETREMIRIVAFGLLAGGAIGLIDLSR